MNELLKNLKCIDKSELTYLLNNFNDDDFLYAKKIANSVNVYGNKVFIRGLIEFTNYCKNDCKYCGLRVSNKNICRYRMTKEEIVDTIKKGVEYGLKSFVFQGGEDISYNVNDICEIVRIIKNKFGNVAITLSIGEKSYEEYKKYKDAGVDRYLLREETITKTHYQMLHNKEMSYEKRIRCLDDLKNLCFQVGAGFMVGSPFQTMEMIASDIFFLKNFKPEMVGIGPFIPQKDTEFAKEKIGNNKLTLFIISLIRIFLPKALIPSTTALSYSAKNGFIDGINSSANVIMLNLTPKQYRENYLIYNKKDIIKDDFESDFEKIKKDLDTIGKITIFTRGDYEEY